MDGSGPRGRTASGEETVEEVRNLEDGTCRGRQPREGTDPQARVVEGAQNPRRGDLGREAGVRTAEESPERGPSLREPLRTFGSGAGRWTEHLEADRHGEEGAANRCRRYVRRSGAPRGGVTLGGRRGRRQRPSARSAAP
jgi:hypothetical protein